MLSVRTNMVVGICPNKGNSLNVTYKLGTLTSSKIAHPERDIWG